MMGQQTRTESLFYYFRLEEQIPKDHLLRLIDRYVDFSFVDSIACFGWTNCLGLSPLPHSPFRVLRNASDC